MKNKKLLKIIIIISFFLIPLQEIYAQEEIDTKKEEEKKSGDESRIKLGKVIVTATKTSRLASHVPASVSVIDKEDIQKSTGYFIDQSLKSVSGVYLKRSKFQDAYPSVLLRGFNGADRNLVLLDGQPLNDGYGANVPWSAIPTDNIERVEVVKGPFSSLYGRHAMGGVINIITKKPKKREVVINAGYGTYDTKTGHVHYADRYFNKLGIYLSVDHKSTDGYVNSYYRTTFSPGTGADGLVFGWKFTTDTKGLYDSGGDPYFLIGEKGKNFWKQMIYGGKVDFDITKKQNISFFFKISEYTFGYAPGKSYLRDSDGFPVVDGDYTIGIPGTDHHKSIRPYSFVSGDSNSFLQLYSLQYKGKFDIFNLSSRLGWIEEESDYITPLSGSDAFGGKSKISKTDPKRSVQFEVQGDIKILKIHTLTLGFDFRYDSAKGEEWNLFDYSNTSNKIYPLSSLKGKQRTVSGYAQWESVFIKRIRLFAGCRFDHWQNFDGESQYTDFLNGIPVVYSTTSIYHFSPKTGLVINPDISKTKKIWKITALRGSYGLGFNPPGIYRLYKTWQYFSTSYLANPGLKPETSISWEVGLDQSLLWDRVKLSCTFFQSWINDLMYRQTLSDSPTVKQYKNAGKGEITGTEAEIKIFILSWLETFGNITWTDTKITKIHSDLTNIDSDLMTKGRRFQHVPRIMYNAGFKVHWKYIESSINYRYAGKQYGSSDNTDRKRGVYGAYDPIRLLDIFIALKPFKHFKVGLSVNNVLDYEYYSYYKCEGRTFFGKAELKF